MTIECRILKRPFLPGRLILAWFVCYLICRVSENGVETLNVVREGDITDADIADAEQLVKW